MSVRRVFRVGAQPWNRANVKPRTTQMRVRACVRWARTRHPTHPRVRSWTPMPQPSPLQPGDATDLAEDVRLLFDELSERHEDAAAAYAGDCHPSLDVRETEETVEVTIDVAGVPAHAIRILFRSGILIIAGIKTPSPALGSPGLSSRRTRVRPVRARRPPERSLQRRACASRAA